MKILGLDVASLSTGWALLSKDKLKKYGIIALSGSKKVPVRLAEFRVEICGLIKKTKPDVIVAEDTYLRFNVKTLKTLGMFHGVACEAIRTNYEVDVIYLTATNVRKVIGVKNKQEAFDYLVDRYKLKDFEFDKDNDVTDAIALALAYYNLEANNAD